MPQALLQAVRDSAPLTALLIAALAGVTGALVILNAARRRLARSYQLQEAGLAGAFRPSETHAPAASRALELGAALVPLLVIATTLAVAEHARATILDDRVPDSQLAEALESQLAGSALGLLATSLALLLAGVAGGLAAAARMRIEGLRASAALRAQGQAAVTAPGPRAAALAGIVVGSLALAFGPVLLAGVVASLELLDRWYGLANLDPFVRIEQLDLALRAARATLARGFGWSVAGTGVATTLAVVLAWKRTPSRRGRARADLALGAGALAVAATLAVLAEPMRRENAMAWPAGTRQGLRVAVPTPKLEGPDPVGGGPLIELTRDRFAIDRVAATEQELQLRLRERTEQVRLLRPNEPFAGSVYVVCGHDTPSERVSRLLGALARAGYRAPTFVFDAPHVSERPVLGTVVLHRISGARTSLVEPPDAAAKDVDRIDPGRSSSCAELCTRIVSARRDGREVELLVPHQP